MEQIDARTLVTLLSFAAFIGIVLWAWSDARHKRFDEAAQLPFLDGDLPAGDGPGAAKEPS
jgi:cytochrome c oxidase cbb3-type subunit 4